MRVGCNTLTTMTDDLRTHNTRIPTLIALSALALATNAFAMAPPEAPVVVSQTTIKRPVPAKQGVVSPAPAATPAPVVVDGPAPGQAGYVHYFIITGPDGEPESHVGIEMADQRIAWSFPELGVTISRFIRNGAVFANGKPYDVEYLYGLKPFHEPERMRSLQTALPQRVDGWVSGKTPYCTEEIQSQGLCVSCLGFVLRVLFPGSSAVAPAMPADFQSVRRNVYTTEDLLLYLAGVRAGEPRDARLKRIAAIELPENLREQLVRIASAENAPETAVATPDQPKPSIAKPRATGRSLVQTPRRAAMKRGS